MSLQFITVIDNDKEPRQSSLSISDKAPDVLRVVGGLDHGTEFRPKTLADAQRLVDWLIREFDVKVTP